MGIARSALARRVRAFVKDTRAGATAIAAAALTVMTVGAGALITDHVWLFDQRDVLKTAADAASIAATLDLDRQLARNPGISDRKLQRVLVPLATRYVLANLAHLSPERFKRAEKTLRVALEIDRVHGNVNVTAKADLGGTLFSRNLPLLGNYEGPRRTHARGGVESKPIPVELVFTADLSHHMVYRLDGSFDKVHGHLSPDTRLAVVIQAAKELVALLEPNARERIAMGLVPWTNQVRLDDAMVEPWAARGWSKVVPGTHPPTFPGEACFAGKRVYSGVAQVPSVTNRALYALPAAAPFAEVLCRLQFASQGPPLPPMLPLSNDRAVIESRVDALFPFSDGRPSDAALGVLWAQRMLEPAWKGVWGGSIHPADRTLQRYARLRKAIVLLMSTDDQPQGITLGEACTAAKSRGTEIFVIAAMTPSEAAGAMGDALRACSSEDDKAYPAGTRRPEGTYIFLDTATPAKLKSAFADIASQLRTLRKVS